MNYKALGVLALAIVGVSAAMASARPLPSNFQINEVLMNPDGGGGDINSGREFIEIYGPANTSLDTYAIVVVENEEDGDTNNDRGRVKNIFKFDNTMSTDSNGLFIIRDNAGAADTAAGAPATFTPTDPLTSGHRWDLDFSTVVDDSPVRGNTLENEGMNIFLVQGINTNLVQKQEDAGEDTVVDGTDLDTDNDGVFDYYADGDGDRIINGLEGSPSGTKLADAIIDFVFVGEADYETETDENHAVSNKPERNLNYILQFLPGGASPFTDFEKGYVICDIRLGADDNSSWTPDDVARVGDWDGVIFDVVANSNAQNMDTNERGFSHKNLESASNWAGTLSATPGRVNQFTVQDKYGVTWTH